MKRSQWFYVAVMVAALVCLSTASSVAKTATPWPHVNSSTIPNPPATVKTMVVDDVGDPVNFDSSLIHAADYLRQMQADVTEDNAGNGTDGVDEVPDDPDDGGWDWALNSPPDPFAHSTSSSPPNLYGVTALGLYYAYLETSDAAYFTAMKDAADIIITDQVTYRSGSDIIFLMHYNALAEVSGSAAADSAKAKFDGRITVYGSATGLAETIRDVRGVTQGYSNGIIAWDIAYWVRAAELLSAQYPADPYNYHQAAVDMAEVLWQDSFNDNPGLFDIVDDAGFDPTGANTEFWWYTLGISGLIESFRASNTHTDEIPDLVTRLLESQYSTGGISDSYGANPDNASWQSTAYSAQALGRLDQTTYQSDINRMCYWLGATQHSSGGWVSASDGEHLPEVGAECASAIYFSGDLDYAIIDDDFNDQTEVDAYNLTHSTKHIFGYDAFKEISEGVAAISSGVVQVQNGYYILPLNIVDRQDITVTGEDSIATIFSPLITYSWDVASYGSTRQTGIRVVSSDNITFTHMKMDFDQIKGNNVSGLLYWNSTGEISSCVIQNMNVSDAAGGYTELTSYFRAPNFTNENRAHIDILNNVFLKTGRLAVVTHDWVDVLIDSCVFDKVEEDFGYALEIGSMSSAVVTHNSFANYSTWAATDNSTAAAIYIENSFTGSISSGVVKNVQIDDNEITACQYGIYIGNEFENLAGDVDIEAFVGRNSITGAATSGSWSSGGIVITDEGYDKGSSVHATLDSNYIENNSDNGIYIYTEGNGEINLEMTNNQVRDHIIGVTVANFGLASGSLYDLSIYSNVFANPTNALNTAAPGYWDYVYLNVAEVWDTIGNCWSDYYTNSGFPDQYNVLGSAGTIDRKPRGDCDGCCIGNRGNVNADPEDAVNIADVTYLVEFLFGIPNGPAPICIEEGNVNADILEAVNISDMTYLVAYLFDIPPGPVPPPCPGSTGLSTDDGKLDYRTEQAATASTGKKPVAAATYR